MVGYTSSPVAMVPGLRGSEMVGQKGLPLKHVARASGHGLHWVAPSTGG